eukprot:6733138-Alexandrium_andersonii.AAC.1
MSRDEGQSYPWGSSLPCTARAASGCWRPRNLPARTETSRAKGSAVRARTTLSAHARVVPELAI